MVWILKFCNVISTQIAQVLPATPQTDVGLPGDSDRKRKVTELFGDISDMELEDLDSLDSLCGKSVFLRTRGTVLLKEGWTFYYKIQHKKSLYFVFLTCAYVVLKVVCGIS